MYEKTISELAEFFGDQISTSMGIRLEHVSELSRYERLPPDAVVFAENRDDIQKIVQICTRNKTPIIPYGTGTSMEGHTHAVNGGVTIDLSGMNKILRVSNDDFYAVVEPGVTREQLNAHLRDLGLFFPVDPGADASLGGMTSTSASGTTTVRYGTMADNVLSLEVLTPEAKFIRTRSFSKKTAAGLDLTRLYVGSEGTLGILTEITVKLYGIPERISSTVCNFPTLESAIGTVVDMTRMGVPIARVELVDEDGILALNKASALGLA